MAESLLEQESVLDLLEEFGGLTTTLRCKTVSPLRIDSSFLKSYAKKALVFIRKTSPNPKVPTITVLYQTVLKVTSCQVFEWFCDRLE